MPQQDWFTANAPKAQTPPSGDWFASNAPKQAVPKTADAQSRPASVHPNARIGREVIEALKGSGRSIIGIPKAIYQTVTDPLGTIAGIGEAQGRVFDQAADAYDKGDYFRAAVKGAEYLIPIAGPMMSEAGDKMEQGRFGEAIGELGTNTLLTAAPFMPRTPKVKPPLRPAPVNPAEAAAVQFAKNEGIPLDLATATGSQRIRNLQKRVGNTVGGGFDADALQAAQNQNLTRVGNELAGRVSPTPTNPVAAGEGVRAAITKGIERDHAAANAAYSTVRKNAATAQMDMTPFKSQAKPLYERLMRENSIAPLQGGKGKALVALDRIMNGPDMALLADVDAALGDFKAIARGAEMPELRTGGQGIAANAVQMLDTQVRASAAKAGVLKELEAGRAATRAKYAKADVLDMLSPEPGQVFRQLTMNKDVALERLKAVERVAPQELPNIGRAYLEDMIQQATSEGGFAHTDRLLANWQKLGPQSKAKLFGKLTPELDQYFLLGKKIKENPNPSGTATIPKLNMAEVLAYLPAKVLSKLLFTPGGVKALTTARIASRNPSRATQAVALSQLSRAAQSAGVSLDAMPALAADPTPTRPERPR